MWYYMQDGAQQGPVAEEELQKMAHDGRLQPSDMVWRSGMQEWQQANQVPSLPFTAPPIPQPPTGEPPPMGPPPSGGTSYGAPSQGAPGFQGAYGAASTGPQMAVGGPEITNYLPWAIVVTLLCCVPGGVISIVYANKANSAKMIGNFTEAESAAKLARMWIFISVGVSLAIMTLYLLLVIIGVMAEG